MKQVKQVILPKLYYPFPPAINEHADTAHEGTVDWAGRFRLLPGEAAYRLFSVTSIGRLAARTHPDVPLDELQLISDWYSWLFFRDDKADDSEIGRHPGQLSAADGRLLDVLEGDKPTERDEPLAHALRDLRERLRERLRIRGLSGVWMRRFVRAVRGHLEATLWEATNRALAAVPDPTLYVRMRPLTGGLQIITELLEIIDGIHLPTKVREHPKVQRLTEGSHRVACWTNDIISLEKELRHGEVNNLVVVLHHAYGLTLQQAIDRAAEMHNAEVCAFVELETCLPSFGSEVDANLRRYVSALRARMRGVLDWSYESERYRTGVGTTDWVARSSMALQR